MEELLVVDVGQGLRLRGTFRPDEDSAPEDPTSVELRIRAPGTLIYDSYTTPELQHPSTGVYEFDLEVDRPGVWIGKWYGTGDINAARSFTFQALDAGM